VFGIWDRCALHGVAVVDRVCCTRGGDDADACPQEEMKSQVIYSNENEKRHLLLPNEQGAYREIDSIIQQENNDDTIYFSFRKQLFPLPSR
jgi:hypothetical protein